MTDKPKPLLRYHQEWDAMVPATQAWIDYVQRMINRMANERREFSQIINSPLPTLDE